MELHELLSAREAGTRAGVTDRTIRNWVHRGILVPAYRGRSRRGPFLFHPHAVDRAVALARATDRRRTRDVPVHGDVL